VTDEEPDSAVIAQTRRRFVQALGSAGVGAAVSSVGTAADTRPADVDDDIEEIEGTVGGLSFYSPASQLNASKEPLEDDDVALVRAESTAFNFETTEDGPETVLYGEDDPAIPLVSQDKEMPVVGFSTIDFARDTTGGFRNDNEMFLLNLFDELMGQESLVAFDEAHQFFQPLSDYQAFSSYAESAGHDIRVSDDLLASGGLTVSSTASQVNASEEPLTDSDRILVWAEPTATNIDNQGDDAVEYPDGTDIPLVSRDGDVVGFGTPELIHNGEFGIPENNDQFLLNLLEDTTGGSGTIVWDDAHGTFWDSSKFSEFAGAVGEEGYEVLSSGDDILTGSQPEMEFASTSSLLDEDDDGGLLFTAKTQPVVWAAETATNLDISESLVVDDDGPGLDTTHAWLFQNVDFQGEVDTVTVDYPDTASLDGLDETNIRVLLTRELSGGPDMSEVSVNSDDYTGSTATFDLSGVSKTSIVGPVSVRIDGITNPDATDYDATITFEGADDQVTRTASPARDGEGDPEGNTDTVPYPESFDIPLVGIDETGNGAILGVGADLVSDGSEANNRTVLLNAWEDLLGGTGTVLYDETHGQNRTLSGDYSTLKSEAEGRGFTLNAIAEGEDFVGALDGADAVMLAGDDGLTGFQQAELDALSAFVSNGNALFVHDTSYVGGDSTDVLNNVFAAVGATFRFNVDQVTDGENNGSEPSIPRTSNYNNEYHASYFEGLGDPTGGLDSADVVAIPSPSTAYTQGERDALSSFVTDGGTVLLFDQSDFGGYDETANLNAIADSLGLAFRFNTDQVEDTGNSINPSFVLTTMKFNDQFDLFGGFGTIGLPDADGVVITSPTFEFQDFELDALSSFVDSGGAVFLFDQSDFGGQGEEEEGFDETGNLNAIADSLGLDFRFNSDQVNDEVNNTGSVFDPLTANYDVDPDNPGVFAERDDGIGIEFDPEQEYFGQVVEVVDGDTFILEFDEQHTDYGYRDTVRHLGVDTAETGNTENDPKEWFGIPDDALDHVDTWGTEATQFALDLMAPEGAEAGTEIAGRSVKMRFDETEPVRGGFGRLLSYMDYDPDAFDADPETGSFDTEYNIQTVEEGYARVYSSGFGRHDEFAAIEEQRLASETGVWSGSDFDALAEYRTGFVERAFLPRASSVRTTDGPLDGGDPGGADDSGPAPVLRADDTATQEPLGDGEYVEYNGKPVLAGVDVDSRVAMFGGQLLAESYEAGEDDDITDEFDLDTAGNFTLFTNTVEMLGENNGPVLVEGGHGQFGVDGGATLEDLKFYLRHIEGLSGQVGDNARLRQLNDLVETLPTEDDPRAVVLTAPGREYTDAELDALADARDAGTAVVLVGSAAPDAESRARLNNIANALETDLRLNGDRVLDETAPLTESELLVTESVGEADGLRVPVNLNRTYNGTGVMAAFDNVGSSAWSLEAATDGVELGAQNNPQVMFEVGERHHIENRGGAEVYPLAFQDGSGATLLSQDGQGSFQDDPEVDWVDTGRVVEFTLTEALAADLDSYVCPVAQSMTGDILTSPRLGGPPQVTAQFDGPPRDLDSDGLFEDIDGDGTFDIFDVQALFNELENDTVQEYGEFFDFNGDGSVTTIFDVQALFNRL